MKKATPLCAALAIGLAVGLYGVTWGLPGAHRLRAFPERLLPTPNVAQMFAQRWARLYDELRRSHAEKRSEEPVTYVQGVDVIAPDWAFPPDTLLNSYRSLLLQSESPDEKKSLIILSQMQPGKLDFKPLYLVYSGAYIYPLGAFLKLLSWLRAVSLVPDMSHYLQKPDDMGRLYLGGRLFILLFFLGSVWILYDIGARLRDARAGVYAAVFFALCPLVVVNSHVLKPHPYAAFWALAALRSMLLAFQSGSGRDYRLCGLLGGVAFGANFSLAYFAGLPALAWLGRCRRPEARAEFRQAVFGCLLALVPFVLTNPYFIFARHEYLWELSYQQHGFHLVSPLTILGGLIKHMGPLFFASAVIGMFAAGREKGGAARLLAWSFVPSFVLLWLILSVGAAGFVESSRYYYPLVGWLCLLAAYVISGLPGRLRALVLTAVLIDSGLRSWVYLENMRRDSGPRSTHAQAASWIEDRIPAGSSIGLDRYPEPAHTPPFRYDRYRLVIYEQAEMLAGRYPDYLVVEGQERPELQPALRQRYSQIAVFAPFRLAWAHVIDDSFFANRGFFVFKLDPLVKRPGQP